MEIEFLDRQLALLDTDRASETPLPPPVIHAWRNRAVLIRAVPDVRTLRNWQSLGYEVDEASEKHTIRLMDRWRIVFDLNERRNPPVMMVAGIDEYHEIFGRVEV
jgi:plasmid maintenance system killer protein